MKGFITDDEIKKYIEDGHLITENYDENCLESIMYDLRLGSECYITRKGKCYLKGENDFITIEPGQFALLTTYEYLKIPNNFFAMITIKFTHKGKGLVNVSGFHVDPGFEGRLVFSVFNAGKRSITLGYKQAVFSILFYFLEKEVEPKKVRVSPNIPIKFIDHLEGATFPSLIELEKEVRQNSTYIKILSGIMIGLLIAVIGTMMKILLG